MLILKRAKKDKKGEKREKVTKKNMDGKII